MIVRHISTRTNTTGALFCLTPPTDNKPRGWPATTKWEQKLNDYILGFDDGLPRFRHYVRHLYLTLHHDNLPSTDQQKKWQEVFEQQPPGNPVQVIRDTLTDHLPRFSLPLGENTVKWTRWLSEEALWARINTLSQIAVLTGEDREAAVKVFKDTLQGDDVERNQKGEIAVHGVTYFAWTDRI